MNTVRRTGSCVHLDVYKRTHGVGSNSPYSSIHTMFVTCLARGSLEMKAKFGQCQECDNRRGRLHACLHCVFFGCFTNGHMVRHFETTGHIISMDMKFGNVFCHECNDYMYDAKFEDVSKKWKEMEDKRSAAIERQQSAAGGSGVVRSVYASSIGLTGFANVGNTCYINCMVQVLVNTVLLRDYFLNDTHQCNMELCIVCEMSQIFQKFYCGNQSPSILARLVYLTYIHTRHLGGPQQEDSHEFFVLLCDIMHRQCQGIEEPNVANKCSCIIDQTFTGYFHSDIVCKQCSRIKTTYEPFKDILLNIEGSTAEGEKRAAQHPVTLLNCIARYTHPEDVQVNCDCGFTLCTKRVAFKDLPANICFHIKRLDLRKKNSTHVIFYEWIDMSPFMDSTLLPNTSKKNEVDAGDNKMYLYGVVCHKGNRHGGHFISYVRQNNKWYKCDDRQISQSTLIDVLSCEGYLLFYQKQVLVSVAPAAKTSTASAAGNSSGRRRFRFFGPGG